MPNLEPRIDGQHQTLAISQDSPGIFGQHAMETIVDGFQLNDGESVDIDEAGTCLIQLPNGDRFISRITSGTLYGPLVVLQVADVAAHVISREADRLHAVDIQTDGADNLISAVQIPRRSFDILAILIAIVLPALCSIVGIALVVGALLMDLAYDHRAVLIVIGGLNVLVGQRIASCHTRSETPSYEEGAPSAA